MSNFVSFKEFIVEGISPDTTAEKGKTYSKEEALKFWKIDSKDLIYQNRNKKKPIWINDLTSKTLPATTK